MDPDSDLFYNIDSNAEETTLVMTLPLEEQVLNLTNVVMPLMI